MQESVSRILEQKTDPLEIVTSKTSVGQAVARMNDRNIGSVLVIDDGRLVGIFTERDVLTRIVPRRLDPEATPVGEVMTRKLVTIGPTRTVQEAMMVVSDTRHRHLPVVDGDRVLGMVSIGDLTRWMVRDQQRTIDDLFDYVRRA